MKLSQIRNLSWTAALVAIAISGYFITNILKKTRSFQHIGIEKWTEPKVDTTKYDDISKMSDHDLKRALHFITKRTPPPPPPKPDKKPPVAETVVQEAPKPEVFKPSMKLTLIAYDDKPNPRHCAFIISKRYAHPYFIGDTIEGSDSTLAEVHQNYVIVKNSRGVPAKLTIEFKKSTAVNSVGNLVKAVARVVPRVEKKTPPKPPVPKPNVSKTENKTIHRTVPKWRRATANTDYGINVIEYTPEADGSRRFAISDNDLKKLENNKFRLMTEASPEVAYDASGVPIGIKVVFNTETALLGKYGIKDGDILTHIDDTKVSSTEQGMKLYENMDKNTRRVKVQMRRNNRPITMFLEMDDFPNAPGVNR